MQLDRYTDDRFAVIEEIASQKPQIEPEKEFPTTLYYVILSLILFAVTYALPGAMQVWFVLAGIGIIVGTILWAIKVAKVLDGWIREDERKRKYH